MARNSHNSNEWTQKIMALVKVGNVAGATAQIRVAPTVADLKRLQAALAAPGAPAAGRQLETVVAEHLVLLSAPRLHRSP
ncbi:hypothetical protein [Acidovorax sp. Leaf160]|uniref:hypothetical protein n=1 Tax=Acidovorax sp. Leaf160 TaxID=1736280 RepID=UPI000701DFAC|nr:hypothetical protein [Acidovorax sp. Leaf160]KQR44949.1 hypothetical protein ASF94_09805 [Acidovorax sp. Leaf160]